MENNETKLYTVIIYTQNQTGLLQQFTNIFTRHNLDIWSLFASPSAVPGCHKLTIETRATEQKIVLAVKQIEKKIEVIRTFFYADEDLLAERDNAGKLDIVDQD